MVIENEDNNDENNPNWGVHTEERDVVENQKILDNTKSLEETGLYSC